MGARDLGLPSGMRPAWRERYAKLPPAGRRQLDALLPIAGFRPSPKQEAFLQSLHRRRLLRAGNQVGKSVVGAHEAWGYAVGLHPWKDVPPPPTTGLVISADWGAYVDVVSRIMHDTAPLGLLRRENDYTRQRGWKNRRITLKNGSQILFRSANQGTTAIAGLTVDWVWIDEPPPPEVWSEAVTRAAVRMGPVWMTMTPIGRPVDWLRLHVEGDPGRDVPPKEDWEQYRIRLTTDDCPHRTQASIEAQIAGYSTWELPQRRDGEWEGVEVDRMVDAFGEACLGEPLEETRYKVGVGMDHGENAGKECVVVVFWSRRLRKLFVVEEYQSETTTTPGEDFAGVSAALGRRGVTPASVDRVVGDVNTAGKGSAGARVNDLFEPLFGRSVGVPNKGPGSVAYGVRLLNYGLRSGMVSVSPRCVRLIKSLKNWTGANDDLKDFVDALRYIAVPILEEFMSPDQVSRLRIY